MYVLLNLDWGAELLLPMLWVLAGAELAAALGCCSLWVAVRRWRRSGGGDDIHTCTLIYYVTNLSSLSPTYCTNFCCAHTY